MLIYWYGITSVILGVILFFPTRKFVLAISTNRLQRKEQRAATEAEAAALRRRATIVAAVVALTFAFVYNRVIMYKFFGELAP
ncbi:MAG: hypothetical protein Kow0025_18840 [Thermodesulfovibrionales bacterium]